MLNANSYVCCLQWQYALTSKKKQGCIPTSNLPNKCLRDLFVLWQETAVGLTMFTVAILGPAGWVLANLENYRNRDSAKWSTSHGLKAVWPILLLLSHVGTTVPLTFILPEQLVSLSTQLPLHATIYYSPTIPVLYRAFCSLLKAVIHYNGCLNCLYMEPVTLEINPYLNLSSLYCLTVMYYMFSYDGV